MNYAAGLFTQASLQDFGKVIDGKQEKNQTSGSISVIVQDFEAPKEQLPLWNKATSFFHRIDTVCRFGMHIVGAVVFSAGVHTAFQVQDFYFSEFDGMAFTLKG